MKKKTTLLCLVLSLCFTTVFAQNWEKYYTNPISQFFLKADAAPDGNLIVLGRQDSSQTKKVIFVSCIDQNGALVWSYFDEQNVAQNVFHQDILASSDSSIYFSTRPFDTNPFVAPNRLQKLNSSGQELWEVEIPLELLERTSELIETSNHEVIAVGRRNGVMVDDGSVMKYDSDGNLVWELGIADSRNVSIDLTNVIQLEGGDFLVLGQSGPYSDELHLFLARVSSSGVEQWQKLFPQNKAQLGLDIIQIDQNEFVIAVMNIEVSTSDVLVSLLSIDQDGTMLWSKDVSDSIGFNVNLVKTSDGFAMGGTTINNDIGQGLDYQYISFDRTGNILDIQEYGRQSDEILGTLVSFPAGELFLCGYENIPAAISSGYLVKIDNRIPVSTEERLQDNINIQVFPNPMDKQAMIQITGTDDLQERQLLIYNHLGQLLQGHPFSGSIFQFEKGNLTAGIYYFQILSEGRILGNGKIIIQ